jgi:hypothetical protein
MVQGGPASLVLSQTVLVPAGATLFEAFVLFGSAVELDLQGSTAGETVDYALYPSNTTTNAQAITTTTVDVQHNDVRVAGEPALDFEDAGGFVWTIADDAANSRVKITPPRLLTGRIAADGTITAGTGFTITKGAAGLYTINHTVNFGSTPVVLLQPVVDGYNLTHNGAVNDSGAVTTVVQRNVASGVLTDQPWQFVAIVVN